MQDVSWQVVGGEIPDHAIAALARLLIDCVEKHADRDIETPVTKEPALGSIDLAFSVAT